MPEHQIEYVRGLPESLRQEAAQLYDAAFGAKIAVAVRRPAARIDLISKSLLPPFAIAAISNNRLVGIAGFHTSAGSLTGGMNYKQLISNLGLFQGNWAALVFSLYERKPSPNELLMDGIAVIPQMRGQGIGARLLSELNTFARQQGYNKIRLDVIDTNPAAKRLYENNGFVAINTERFGYLRWLLGFGASTTMVRCVATASQDDRRDFV